MFRSPEYCVRYEYIPIQLDTLITTPGANEAQRKNGYQFTINDRSSYFGWFNAYFEVDFRVVQEANAEYLAAVRVAMINDAASLIANLQVKQNGKTVYANSSATSEYLYLQVIQL